MSPVEGLLYGLSVAVAPENLLAALLGAVLGTAIGVLPGLGPVAGTALVLPLTFALPPLTGLIALGGMYYGAMYGGSTTSILLKIPGESASVVTAIDGYEMTRRGRAGAALAVVALGSFLAGTVSLVGIVVAAPALASLALSFGPAEFLALMVVGLLALSRITGGSLIRSLFLVALGLALATVGIEPVTGVPRFSFGTPELTLGIELVPAAVGLFGIAEVLRLAESSEPQPGASRVPLRELFPTREELRRSLPAWLRGIGVGFLFGVLPGPSPTLASFTSYRLEQLVSRRRHEFGRGAVEGVAGPEAANNAAATSSFIPLLSLGLPFTPTLALMLAAMLVHGVHPGPLLLDQRPDVFWGVVASMYIGNVILLILNLPLVGIWVSALRIPQNVLISGVVLVSVVGTYSVRNSFLDVYVLMAFGVLGYVLEKLRFEVAPLILALVLGPLIEKHLLEGLYLARGDMLLFVRSPIAVAIWLLGLGLLVAGTPAVRRLGARLVRRAATGTADSGPGRS